MGFLSRLILDWLFLNQQKNLFTEACNSDAKLDISVAQEYDVG